MKEKDTILLRDPDSERLEQTRRILSRHFVIATVNSVAEVHELLARSTIHALVARELPADPDGVTFCRAVHQHHPEIKSVLVAANDSQRPLIEAFNENRLYRCLLEPVAPETLTRAVRDAVRRFEMDRVQNHLIARAAEIDRTLHSVPYWLYRIRSTMGTLACMVGGSLWLCILAGIVLLLAAIGAFLVLYYVKSALGIDFFGDRHLKDFISP